MPLLPHEDGFWRAATPREGRARLLAALRFELLGPEAPEEELRESPLSRYATGMLAPFGTDIPEEEREEDPTGGGDDEEAGAVEFGPPMSQAITPSSIGLSFLVPAVNRTLTVLARWGDYRIEEVREEDVEEAQSTDKGLADSDGDAGNQKEKRRRP